MNRRERRATAKRLGIMKYQRSLPRNERFELIRENIVSGRKMHEDFRETAIISREEAENNHKVHKINQKAMILAARTGKSIDEAVDIIMKQEKEKENTKNKKLKK